MRTRWMLAALLCVACVEEVPEPAEECVELCHTEHCGTVYECGDASWVEGEDGDVLDVLEAGVESVCGKCYHRPRVKG